MESFSVNYYVPKFDDKKISKGSVEKHSINISSDNLKINGMDVGDLKVKYKGASFKDIKAIISEDFTKRNTTMIGDQNRNIWLKQDDEPFVKMDELDKISDKGLNANSVLFLSYVAPTENQIIEIQRLQKSVGGKRRLKKKTRRSKQRKNKRTNRRRKY
jgi:hypothetical protein